MGHSGVWGLHTKEESSEVQVISLSVTQSGQRTKEGLVLVQRKRMISAHLSSQHQSWQADET